MLAETSHIVLIWGKCHVLEVESSSFASTVMNHRLLFSVYSIFGIFAHLPPICEFSLPVIHLFDTAELLLGWRWEVLKFIKFTSTHTKNKATKTTNTQNNKQTNVEFVLCWSAYSWGIYDLLWSKVNMPGDILLEKTNFPFLLQVSVANSFLIRAGTQCTCPSFNAGSTTYCFEPV